VPLKDVVIGPYELGKAYFVTRSAPEVVRRAMFWSLRSTIALTAAFRHSFGVPPNGPRVQTLARSVGVGLRITTLAYAGFSNRSAAGSMA
jgi:hypothetical protein